MYGYRLKSLRKNIGKTQEEVAAGLGVTRGAYSHFENDRNEPDYETLRKLAEYFHVSTDYLLGHTDDPTTAKTFKEKISRLLSQEHSGSITLFPNKEINRPYTINDWPAFLASLPEDQAMHYQDVEYPDDQKVKIMELARKAKQKKMKKIEKFLKYSDEVIDDALIYAAFDDEKRKKMNEED